jgi:hypothetical protein
MAKPTGETKSEAVVSLPVADELLRTRPTAHDANELVDQRLVRLQFDPTCVSHATLLECAPLATPRLDVAHSTVVIRVVPRLIRRSETEACGEWAGL